MTVIKYYNSSEGKTALPSDFGGYMDTSTIEFKNNVGTPSASHPSDVTVYARRGDCCIELQIGATTYGGYGTTSDPITLPETYRPFPGVSVYTPTSTVIDDPNLRVGVNIVGNTGALTVRTHGPVRTSADGSYSGYVVYPARNKGVEASF